ncbi:MAG: nitrate transport permease nrtB [Chromatiales bacterium 21-64-14]|nr:MAG: nitrate transport permease nrtB [Chromatiales bacterium 21-64-14]HQU16895.1 ABC transporter permease [Gammaproteobacteria bacterium]
MAEGTPVERADAPVPPPHPPAPAAARAPDVWQIRGQLSGRRYFVIALAGFAFTLGFWWALSVSGWVNPLFLPDPPTVLHRFSQWLLHGSLLADTRISVLRVTVAFVISSVMAVPLGLYIGAFAPVQAFFEPLMEFARYLPAVAFVPLVLLWVGIGEGSKIAVIWIGTFFQQVLLVAEDVRRVPVTQIEAAQTMGASRGEILKLVLFKSALPGIVDTLRITLGWAWTYLVVAELVASNSGLGFAILQAQRFLQTDKIFVGILMIGVIGLVMDQLLRFMHRRAFPWLYH